jgi:hypothetical protein
VLASPRIGNMINRNFSHLLKKGLLLDMFRRDDESSRGSLWWSMFGDCIGMGRTGAEAHGVRVVFASCSRLRTALTFTFCIICFCGDESTTFAQVCVRAYAFYVWYIGISAHIDKCI